MAPASASSSRKGSTHPKSTVATTTTTSNNSLAPSPAAGAPATRKLLKRPAASQEDARASAATRKGVVLDRNENEEKEAAVESLNSPDPRVRAQACVYLSTRFTPSLTSTSASDDSRREARRRKGLAKLAQDGLYASLARLIASDTDVMVRISAAQAVRNAALLGGQIAVVSMQQAEMWGALMRALGDCCHPRKLSTEDGLSSFASEILAVMELVCMGSSTVAERLLPDSLGVINRVFDPVNAVLGATARERALDLLCTGLEDNALMVRRATEVGLPASLQGLITSALASQSAMEDDEAMMRTQHEVASESGAAASRAAMRACGALSDLNASPLLALTETFLQLFQPYMDLTLPVLSEAALTSARELDDDEVTSNEKAKTRSPELTQWFDVVELLTLGWETTARLVSKWAPEQARLPEDLEKILVKAVEFALMDWDLEAPEMETPPCLTTRVATLQQRAAEAANAAAVVAGSRPAGLTSDRVAGAVSAASKRSRKGAEFKGRFVALVELSKVLASQEEGKDVLSLCLSSAVDASADEESRALAVGAAGEALESPHRSATSQTRAVDALLGIIESDPSVLVCTEAVDCLIDFYSPDERAALYAPHVHKALRLVAKTLARRVRGEGEMRESEAVDRMEEICENLAAFLEWKGNV